MVIEQTFCSLFREVVRRYPDKTAIYCNGSGLTYRELDARSDILACRLVSCGVKREDIVCVATGRSIDTVIAMIGIWKAGAAYFYLNLAFPKVQADEILERCRCPLVIDESFMREINWSEPAPAKLDFSTPGSLAVMIFTSGSTMKPKGVMIEHRNIIAMVDSVSGFAITDKDAVCIFPSFSFVASVSDMFPALLRGAAMYIIEEDRRRDIRLIMDYFIAHSITVSFLPPHMAVRFIQLEESRTKLRLLLVGSENMRNLSLQRYEIRHVYGSSEMCSLISDYVIQDARKSYPVGKVKAGIKYYIMDDDGKPVTPGKDGELWLSGPQLSRGYYLDPKKTAEQYLLNPFTSEPGYERVFKTQDIVRQLEDGNLQYVSRKDNMLKIRGYRVEASAVESVLLQYPKVIDAVVRAFLDSNGTNILCGYFLSEEKLNPKDIKVFLRERLPYYMVPACLIQMEDFPRTMNNKISLSDFHPPVEIDDHKLLERMY